MSVEKHGYPNNVNTNSNGEVYKKKSTAEELAQSKYTQKRNANKNSDCGEKRLSKQCKYTKQRQTEQRKTTVEGHAHGKNTQRFITAQNKHTPDALPQSKNLQQPVFAEKNDTEERLHENRRYERSIDNLISSFHTIVSKKVHFTSVLVVINYGTNIVFPLRTVLD